MLTKEKELMAAIIKSKIIENESFEEFEYKMGLINEKMNVE